MKRILVLGEGLGHEALLVELHAHGVEALTASRPERARQALAESHFDAVVARLEEFAPGAALAEAASRRIALIRRDESASARAKLGLDIDDCLFAPLRCDELLLCLGRRLATRDASGAEFTDAIVGIEGGLAKAWAVAEKAAGFDADVLITGESGTGKELFAGAIHRRSKRAQGPFVAINCAAIPAGLVESQLFGHVRGAFTDAQSDRQGVFVKASGGTLFLDEIGDLSPDIQVKLLRALQSRQVQAIGAESSIKVDVRVISATSRELKSMIAQGQFRDDLYYRLAVVPIALPCLRERREDLEPLLDHFLARFADKHKLVDLRLDQEAREALLQHSWPGNVRELQNAVERLVVLADGNGISVDLLRQELGVISGAGQQDGQLAGEAASLGLGLRGRPLREAMHGAEAQFIAEALEASAGKRSKCAQMLNISQRALLYKIKEHNL